MLRKIIKNILRSDKSRDFAMTLAGQIIIMVCMLVTNKVVSYYSSVEDYGIYNLIRRNSSVICFIMLGGTGITLPRYLPMFTKQSKYITAKNYIAAILLYMLLATFLTLLVALVLFPWIGVYLVGNDSLSGYLILLLYSIGTAAIAFVFSYYRGLEKFIFYNVGQILLNLLLLIPLAFICNLSISYLFLIWAIVHIVFSIAIFASETNKYKFFFFRPILRKTFLSCFKDITHYSLPRLIGDSFLFIISAFPLLYIGTYLSLTDVSCFSVGLSLLSMATPIFSVLGVILLPYISSSLVQRKMHEASSFIKKLSFAYLLLAIVITIAFIVLMPYLISLFFDDKYMMALHLSKIIILSLVPESLYLLYRNPIDALSKTPYNTYIMFLSLIILVVLFMLCNSLESYAWAFVCVASLRGGLSLLTWQMIKFKSE